MLAKGRRYIPPDSIEDGNRATGNALEIQRGPVSVRNVLGVFAPTRSVLLSLVYGTTLQLYGFLDFHSRGLMLFF